MLAARGSEAQSIFNLFPIVTKFAQTFNFHGAVALLLAKWTRFNELLKAFAIRS